MSEAGDGEVTRLRGEGRRRRASGGSGSPRRSPRSWPSPRGGPATTSTWSPGRRGEPPRTGPRSTRRSRRTAASSRSPRRRTTSRPRTPTASGTCSCAISRPGSTTLVSRASGPAGAGGDDGSSRPSISADGRLVAFSSFARQPLGRRRRRVRGRLRARHGPGHHDPGQPRVRAGRGRRGPRVLRRGHLGRRDAGGVRLGGRQPLGAWTTPPRRTSSCATCPPPPPPWSSRATGADGAPADANSLSPSLSADGRLVAFSSLATTLSAEDDDFYRDVFVRDLATGATTLVSRGPGAFGGRGQR